MSNSKIFIDVDEEYVKGEGTACLISAGGSSPRWDLIKEKQSLEKRLEEIEAERAVLHRKAGENLLKYKCSFEDDWTVVLGLRADISTAFCIERATIDNISFVNNFLTGNDSRNYKDFIFFNPIFFQEIGIVHIMKSRPKYLAKEGEVYFACAPIYEKQNTTNG